MFYKKTFVLSSIDDSSLKAVLNLERFSQNASGQVRLYNFKNEPSGILSLGFSSGEKVIKAGLTKQDSKLYSFFIDNEENLMFLDQSEKLSCALINVFEGKVNPLLFGASDGKISKESQIRLSSALSLLDSQPTIQQVSQTLDELEIDFEDEEKEEIEKVIDNELGCEKNCSSCKYRQAFYSTNSVDEEKEDKQDFFEDVKEQINSLFDLYPEEEFLKQIIPNSKWVKVDYENKDEYYVVGLIYEDGKLKYICYGVPGLFSHEAPMQFDGGAQWLPLDTEKPEDYGYWLSYQDAQSGENIKMEII